MYSLSAARVNCQRVRDDLIYPLKTDTPSIMRHLIENALRGHPHIRLAILFGSLAAGKARADSDLDIAVQLDHPMNAEEKISLIETLAEYTGRPVDLIDLWTVGEPLLGQILRHGIRIMGDNVTHSRLLTRHLLDQADFMPLVDRILTERRHRWIGK